MAARAEAKRRKGKSPGNAPGRGAGGAGPTVVSVAAHPRARALVRRAKGWGGLIGFALAAALSEQAGVPPVMVGERAVGAGVAGLLLAWACSVAVCRHLVLAELRTHAETARERIEAGEAALTERALG